MTKKTPDNSDAAWLEKFMAGPRSIDTAATAFRPPSTPAERKADERTRAVREMTDAATDKRMANTARLKAARLEKEAEDRALAALKPSKTAGKRKAKD